MPVIRSIIRIDPLVPASTPTYQPPAERILSGNPIQAAVNQFASTDGRFNAGVWTSEPGSWRVAFTENEFCWLLQGVIRLTEDGGTTETFRAGDGFVIPSGFQGVWEVVEPTKKLYAAYE